jgi:hypothetical protein
MKTQILLGVCICFSIALFGQKDISGIYTNEAGMKIKVDDNLFYYMGHNSPEIGFIIYYNDTLAKCTYNWINDQFIELNSIDDYTSILKSMRFTQSIIDKSNDSILIKFIVPYNRRGKLQIEIYADYKGPYKLEYSQKNQEINIPSNVKEIMFSISPEYLLESGFEGQCYGRIRFNSIEYFIEKNINYIEIEIPTIDNSFFEKYYIKGEYARITQGKIEWKGEVFRKIK